MFTIDHLFAFGRLKEEATGVYRHGEVVSIHNLDGKSRLILINDDDMPRFLDLLKKYNYNLNVTIEDWKDNE